MHILIYISIFITGILIYRLTTTPVLESLASQQVIRSRMSYELNQDLHNLIQDYRKIKNDGLNTYTFGLRKATSAQLISNRGFDTGTSFVSHLEHVVAEQAAYKALKYRMKIHHDFYKRELSFHQKYQVINLLYAAFEYWTYIYPMEIELKYDAEFLELSFGRVESDFIAKLKADASAIHITEAKKVICRINN